MIGMPRDYSELLHLLELWAAECDPQAYCPVLKGNRKAKLLELASQTRTAQKEDIPFEQYMKTVIFPILDLPPETYAALVSGKTGRMGIPLGMIAVPMAIGRTVRIKIKNDGKITRGDIRRILDIKESMPETALKDLDADAKEIPYRADDATLANWLKEHCVGLDAEEIMFPLGPFQPPRRHSIFDPLSLFRHPAVPPPFTDEEVAGLKKLIDDLFNNDL